MGKYTEDDTSEGKVKPEILAAILALLRRHYL